MFLLKHYRWLNNNSSGIFENGNYNFLDEQPKRARVLSLSLRHYYLSISVMSSTNCLDSLRHKYCNTSGYARNGYEKSDSAEIMFMKLFFGVDAISPKTTANTSFEAHP